MAKRKLTESDWEVFKQMDSSRELTEREREVLLKIVGTPEEQKAEEVARRALRTRFDAMRDELVQKYPRQWVAVHRDGEFFVAETHEEVLSWRDEQGDDRDCVLTEYLRPEDEEMILIPLPFWRTKAN